MQLYLEDNRFHYELENVTRLFFLRAEIFDHLPETEPDGDYCAVSFASDDSKASVRGRIGEASFQAEQPLSANLEEKEKERLCAKCIYEQYHRLTGIRPPFGIMTGIRPAKYTAELLGSGFTAEQTVQQLEEVALVSEEKAQLCVQTAQVAMPLWDQALPKGYSLYVSIPFCPSRCSYCSFVSKSTQRDAWMMEPYVEALCKEIVHTVSLAQELGLVLQTVYVGGGTPTVLSAKQLERLMTTLTQEVPAPQLGEFSVEAGRPDTIDEEKLRILKDCGVTRLSINPQTANNEVLKKIGRLHTKEDIEWAYELARRVGFDNINCDLIAGLPSDALESFQESVDWAAHVLKAESITVHALTLKRAALMREDLDEVFSPQAPDMVSYAQELLMGDGYRPYYMYRQKGTVNSLENTGYSIPGKECVYNLFIMDEIQTILACGAGAVSKMVNPRTGLIERIYNLKYPQEYLQRFDEMLQRKQALKEFYHDSLL